MYWSWWDSGPPLLVGNDATGSQVDMDFQILNGPRIQR